MGEDDFEELDEEDNPKTGLTEEIQTKADEYETEFKKKYTNFEEKPFCIRRNFYEKEVEEENKKPSGGAIKPGKEAIEEMV